jgi:mono/diheme cytochrome c family protein
MKIPISEIQDPWEVPEEYETMINPYFGVKDKENLGRMLYLKHCKPCHGNKGKGHAPKALSMDLNVADFTSEKVVSQTDGVLYYKMTTGRNDMPAFEKRIKNQKELWFIINYLRELAK